MYDRLVVAKEEIKERITVKSAIEYYASIVVGRGNINCLFHSEKTPSMSVNDKSYYCHACGAMGDVIGFVMEYLKCDFKTALEMLDRDFSVNILGKKVSIAQQIVIRKRKKEEEKRQLDEHKKWIEYDELCAEYRICNFALQKGLLEPFSDLWIYYTNKKTYIEYRLQEGGY